LVHNKLQNNWSAAEYGYFSVLHKSPDCSMNKISLFCFFICVLINCCNSKQTPTNPAITTNTEVVISGIIAHDSIVSIKRTGFGFKNPSTPAIWDNCETGNITDHWDNVLPNKAPDTAFNMAYRKTIRNVLQAHSNSQRYACGGHCPFTDTWTYDKGPNVALSKKIGLINRFYASWYYRADPLWPDSNDNYKLMYLSDNFLSCTDLNNCWYLEYNPHPNNQEYHVNYYSSPPYYWPTLHPANPRDGWIKVEVLYLRDNFLYVYENGGLKYNYNGLTYSSNPDHIQFGFFWRKTASIPGDSNAFRYYDDIYFDTTFCRVLLSDKTILSSSTILETQIIKKWTDTTITFSANLGNFQPGQSAFLYVFNTDNSAVISADKIQIGQRY
jgi:hypothetical protein